MSTRGNSDTSITCSSTDSGSLFKNIDNEMANIAEWKQLNKLLNTDKNEFMVTGHLGQQNSLNEPREIEMKVRFKVDLLVVRRALNTQH